MTIHLSEHEQALVDAGLARIFGGRLIPVLRGGDPAGDPIFPSRPDDFAALSDDDLAAFIAASEEAALGVSASEEATASFLTDERDMTALLAEVTAGVEALEDARVEHTSRVEAAAAAQTDESEVEEVEEVEVEETAAASLAELATRAAPAEPVVEEVVAAAPPARRALPARSRASVPAPSPGEQPVSMTAALEGFGVPIGADLDAGTIAEIMVARRSQFGHIAPGTSGEKITIAKADWRSRYPDDRKLGADLGTNMELIAAATDPDVIRRNFEAVRDGKADQALVASGGLCAPVTPYYQLMMVSSTARPVRGMLPSFNADRGGIRFATPAALSAVTTGVGTRTAANDFAGGTEGAKTCQKIACPPFSEVDVAILFHCLQFGNLGSRTFPELVAQWNQLTLASHARLADSALLTGIDTASIQVTATNQGFGAIGALMGQILAAADGMRSRHRMDPNTVLRLVLPFWAADLLLSDLIRSQFGRFDMTRDDLVAYIRSFNIEPTFHIDGASGKSQVFGTQAAGALLPFPSTVTWYLYPEGSFIYLDGGTLDLGLVRDSVLNASNDFQLFGEIFENVAFLGVESLAVTSTVCDNGAVSLPVAKACPINYGA